MLWKILFCVAYLAVAHQFCYCDTHTYGKEIFQKKLIFGKKLFDQVEDEGGVSRPKNYTLIFKYTNSNSSGDIYAVFNVMNAESKANFTKIDDNDGKVKLQVMLQIINGTNAVVRGDIYVSSIVPFGPGGLKNVVESKIPKTMTVIYGHNSTQTRNRKIILGHRQNGDIQLSHQTQHVELKYNFPEHEFKYPENGQTSASTYITAVAFSFDTYTAIAFLNSTFISENTFDAIVYDLNFPEFRANMTVYGYRYTKPPTYKPIVVKGENRYF